MPRADKDGVEEKSAEWQRQHREDTAENFATKQVRMPECAHKPQGEQHQPERYHRQVRRRKIAQRREANEKQRIANPSQENQRRAGPHCPVPVSFHRYASPRSTPSTTSDLPAQGARI